MGGTFQNPTMATGLMESQYQSTALWDDTILSKQQWGRERRGPATTWDRIGWASNWSASSMMAGDPSSPMTILGNGQEGGIYYEPPSNIGSGTQTTKFILGTCLDSVGAPVASATLDAFLTATNVLEGTGTSFIDGTYAIGVQTAGVQHYIVAYKAGAPDIAGTTANTLVPTNIDGT